MFASLFGALSFSLIYEYRYGGGDTFWFFQGIEVMQQAFFEDPIAAIKLLFTTGGNYSADISPYSYRIWWFRDDNSFTVIKVGSIFSLFTFGSFLGTAFFFAAISFTGVWQLFKLFADYIPKLTKPFAICFLFVPSVIFWGSGISKDALMLACLGWVTYTFFQIFIYNNRKLKYFIILLIFAYIMIKVRSFLFFMLAPSLLLAWFLHKTQNIENTAFRILAMPFLLALVVGGSALILNVTSNINERYNLENLEKRAYDTQWWHTKVQELEGDQGSHYSLGPPSESISGMLSKFPLAVNVTFFRPYLWESNNVVMLFSALESLVIFLFTLKIFFKSLRKLGGKNSAIAVLGNPYVGFSLLFAIVYGFAVGVTSYNFGALVRYKIPAIPFFLAALFIIQHQISTSNNDKKLEALEDTE